ncbi:MAG: AbrB/MazE/SpoVT family DNA-binding domain-containing protein [Alphaproteobacteria bacterium]|nr:AbrB/MazE/SpoVT family DNA-binding domain-containing protein [Alphaproteobacteria bacterium]
MAGRLRKPKGSRSTAKLFMHGRSQAVRLPKEFRFPGTEVRVSRQGDKVVLEALKAPPFDIKAWRAGLRALGGGDFLPEGLPEQPPMPDDDLRFD